MAGKIEDNYEWHSVSDTNKWVYHYTSKETLLEHILPSGKIRLNTFENLNDPKESKEWKFGVSAEDNFTWEKFDEIQVETTKKMQAVSKILSMVRDSSQASIDTIDVVYYRGFARPRMWAQYAENHSGVCLVFNRQLLEEAITEELSSEGTIYYGNVEYNNYNHQTSAYHLHNKDILKTSLEFVIESKIKEYYKIYYFTKSEDWSSENEWRCVLRGKDKEVKYVSIEKALNGIIVGADFNDTYLPSIKPFAKKYAISLERIHWKNGEPLLLPAE